MPEFRSSYREDDPAAKRPSGRRTRKVVDICTRVQCFSTYIIMYVSVLAPVNPETISELMAHMLKIVRVSQDFSGLAWVRYDAGFCRQAVLTGNRLWSHINATLYALCFTGNAMATTWCELCFASTHSASECEQRGDPDPDMPARIKAIETDVLALAAKQGKAGGPIHPSADICRLWNRKNCTYPHCKYLHICSNCGGDHHALSCSNAPKVSAPSTTMKSAYQKPGARPY